jgi:hypothetical protein
MNSIDLNLDLDNELEFKISVEGTKPAKADCRLIFENDKFDMSFNGIIEGGNRAVVKIPPLDNILEEGMKTATLEMIVDDRIFRPLTLDVNFKKSIKISAEAVIKETPRQATATAVLVTSTHSEATQAMQAKEEPAHIPDTKIIARKTKKQPVNEQQLTTQLIDLIGKSKVTKKPKQRNGKRPIRENSGRSARGVKSLANLSEHELRDAIRNFITTRKDKK